MLTWVFWSFLGALAINVLILGCSVSLLIDNRRLRAQLRKQMASNQRCLDT